MERIEGMEFLHWIGLLGHMDHIVTGLATWAILLTLAVCMAILTKGADLMVGGAVALARLTSLPEIIIGATILSAGTTLPEVFVSVLSAWTGHPGLALGNGVGSVICNTGLILGFTCIVARVPMDRFILNRAGLVLLGAGTLIVLVSLQAYIDAPSRPVLHRWVGVMFLILLAGYLYLSYRWSKDEGCQDSEPDDRETQSIPKALLLTATGLGGVILGSRLLIPCAAEAATRIGVPQDVVAATLVSLGTSLPELATAVVAIRKGHPQIMVGNVIGADILSCLFVIGAAAAATPLQVPANFFRFHFPAMLLILYSFRFFVSLNRDGWFKRIQGAWIFGLYIAYLVLQYRFTLKG
jgi:cation:H+ antiporter